MYFERLSELDKSRIENYIKAYAQHSTSEKMAPLQDILKPWDEAKSGYLSTIFKDNLIITKPIQFQEGETELLDKVEDMLYADYRCDQFMDEIKNIYRRYRDLEWNNPDKKIWYAISHLFSTIVLAQNKVDYTGTIPIKDINYKIQEGAKPMRIITKIANAYGIGLIPDENGVSDLEYFRRVHSQVLNNKMLYGDLCLSIHPLDYMTMSDNDCGWESCMSWENDGEYKQGTVEMMNSPCVVVGYLTSSSSYKFGCDINDEWNSKKWRCLFIVDKDFIINIKGYPYENSNLVKASIIELAKLAGWGEIEPLKYEYYEKYTEYRYKKMPCSIGGRAVAIDFCTQAMYNDFGNGHYIALNPYETKDIIEFHYNDSGVSECVWCGNTDEDQIGMNYNTGALCCSNCDETYYCDCCDDALHGSDSYYTTAEGCKVCEYCWEERTERDITNDSYYLRENMENIRLNYRNGKYEGYTYDFYIYPDNINSNRWNELFKIAEPREECVGIYKTVIYYVLPQDCTREALELIGLDQDEIEGYLRLKQTN